MNAEDTKSAPTDTTPATPRPNRKLVSVAAVAAAVVGLLVVFLTVPGVNQAARFQSPPGEETFGYNITNNSGQILFFQGIGGHVGAPLPVGGAWLPGQTLNFEVEAGTWAWEWYTADAYFEAFSVGGPNNGIDAGTVDVHFNTAPGSNNLQRMGNPPMAYLNPDDTAQLGASAVGFTPRNVVGENWTMVSGGDNRIVSSGFVLYDVDPDWSFQGIPGDQSHTSAVTAAQIRTSILSAKDGNCTTSWNCTLGNTSWNFD